MAATSSRPRSPTPTANTPSSTWWRAPTRCAWPPPPSRVKRRRPTIPTASPPRTRRARPRLPGRPAPARAAATRPGEAAAPCDLDGIATPDAAVATLDAGQTRTDVDFGYRGTAALGDRVWYDIDGNGTQDAGEVGINGVTVELLDGSGDVLLSTVTAGDGGYTFAGLLPGTYNVRAVSSTLPGGVVASYEPPAAAPPL